MKYTDREVIEILSKKGRKLDDYLVVLGSDNKSDTLYFVHQNVLFFDIIEDNELFKRCIEYVKKNGSVYRSEEELKRKRPDIIFND